jgi:hypothetical protein
MFLQEFRHGEREAADVGCHKNEGRILNTILRDGPKVRVDSAPLHSTQHGTLTGERPVMQENAGRVPLTKFHVLLL